MHIKLKDQLIVTWESQIQFKSPIFEPYHILKKKQNEKTNKQTKQPNKKHQASLENLS